jgi:tetratricopeptide (TPR) repeat protein
MDLYKNGDYRGAINELEGILKKDPTNVKALYYSGMANKYMGKESKALDFYNKVPKNNPLYENAQWEIAQIYKSKKNNAQAITALQEVVNYNGTLKVRAQNMIKELGGTIK